MLGDFITRCFVLILGYAYPAFECYKTVEKNRVEIEELRFWCQYWILVAFLTVFERIVDIFVSWLPMYGEMKVAFFIYLWYPKTRGTGYVYETLLRPYVAKHETDIDRKILELRARAWDFFIQYWQNCTQLGQSTLVQIFQQLIAQSTKFTTSNNQKSGEKEDQNEEPPQPAPANVSLSLLKSPARQTSKNKKWLPPTPPPTPAATVFTRGMSDSPRSNAAQAHFRNQSEEATVPEQEIPPSSPMSDRLHEARFRLRRTKPQQ